jgi:hypothetical protein
MTDGGFAKGIPRKRSIGPELTPKKLPPSKVIVGSELASTRLLSNAPTRSAAGSVENMSRSMLLKRKEEKQSTKVQCHDCLALYRMRVCCDI